MVALYTGEVAALLRGPIANVGLLLFIDLSCVDYFLDCTSRDEAEDLDIAGLANAVSAILGLEVVAWVPVGIENNYLVRGSYV